MKATTLNKSSVQQHKLFLKYWVEKNSRKFLSVQFLCKLELVHPFAYVDGHPVYVISNLGNILNKLGL